MINIGNKKIKKLNRGSSAIAKVYKGDELIFQDLEILYGWKFTIDTTLTTTGTHNSNATFTLKRNASWFDSNHDAPIKVKWGDGTEETFTLVGSNGTKSHTYPTAGTYQITIMPTLFDGTTPRAGWLSGINGNQGTNYWNCDVDSARIVSIDKPYPAGSLHFIHTGSYTYGISSLAHQFQSMANIQSYPADLLDYVGGQYSPAYSQAFAFSYFGQNTGCDPFPLAKKWFDRLDFSSHPSLLNEYFLGTFMNTNPASKTIPADLFSNIDTSGMTSFVGMFRSTFANCTNMDSIPATLFSFLDTSHGTNFKQMFASTFTAFGYNSQTITLPANLFSSLNTTNGTNFNNMFNSAFNSFGYNNTSITLPATLLSSVDTSNGTDFEGMFSSAFLRFGYNNPSITIPETLFSTIDTMKGTKLGSMSTNGGMFSATFSEYGYNSTVLTIPEKLFEAIKTPVMTEGRELFRNTFAQCGYKSTAAEIPEKLFWSIDTSNLTRFDNMFMNTFLYYGFSHPKQLPVGIFSTINTANGVNLFNTFSGVFGNCKLTNIPLIFSSLNTANTANFTRTFSGTFGLDPNTVVTIPANLFSNIVTSNGANFSYTFDSTFAGRASSEKAKILEIPATLFSFLDTSNGTNFNGTFKMTFQNTIISQGSIPNTLFSALDTTSGTNFREMFSYTFDGCYLPDTAHNLTGLFDSVKTAGAVGDFYGMFAYTFNETFKQRAVSIPSTLFQYVDFSGATSLQQVFSRTFSWNKISDIPTGLFGGLNIPSGLASSNYSGLFGSTFEIQQTAMNVSQTLGDVFDGMTDFNWVNASTASGVFGRTFATISGDLSTGTAAPFLQHFNFTPNSRTSTFSNRTGLSDYASIPTNWK